MPWGILLGTILLAACGQTSSKSSESAPEEEKSSKRHKHGAKSAEAAEKPSSAPTSAATVAPTASAAGGSANPCKKEGTIRVCDVVAFQKGWSATPAADRYDAFPPGDYKLTGKVKKIDPNATYGGKPGFVDIRMEAGSTEVDFTVDPKSPDLGDAKKLKVGDTATLICPFGGLELVGILTLENCRTK